MATIKTYGVAGMLDWHCEIAAGKSKMKVYFSGGAITSYGTTPAEYTTSDKFTQAVIENSDYFKNKKIILLRSVETEGNASKDKKAAQNRTEVVEVTCLQDAQQHLQVNFGIPSKLLGTKAAVLFEARQRNIEFKGL